MNIETANEFISKNKIKIWMLLNEIESATTWESKRKARNELEKVLRFDEVISADTRSTL